MDNRFKEYYEQSQSVITSKLIYDDGVLTIQGFNQSGSLVIEIDFPDILVVRASDEGIRLKLLHELGPKRALIIVDQQSKLLAWLQDENKQTRDISKARHFIVLIGEEIIDVISISEPMISYKT